ncbi:hypothetical protein BpHYR1_015324 [Brachionus plicatilis]|uniref:Uncharacterized protein n=1 Tax=Brachionus plicatilis TaxID=10195 RepID=A0A3M7RG21_BRAPC|nr:hypothetical protein BpHYR1_015324 [Brachionus plicatilis]
MGLNRLRVWITDGIIHERKNSLDNLGHFFCKKTVFAFEFYPFGRGNFSQKTYHLFYVKSNDKLKA